MVDREPTDERLKLRLQEQDTLIAQLRMTEERLAECELLAHGWFDNSMVGLAQTDADGRFKRATLRFCEMLGYTAQELVGHRGPLDLSHPDE